MYNSFMTKDLTPEQHLSKVTCDIMGKDRYMHLAGILMIGSREVSDDVPTACTNGRDEKYGREFIENMSTAELRFLVLHENYHKMYKHLTTWKHLCAKDPQLANMSMDYNINGKICDENKDGWAVMPEGGLYDERLRTPSGWMDTAEIFNILYEEKEQGNGGGNGDGDGDGDTLDEHDWEGASELSDEEVKELSKEIDEGIRQGSMLAGKQGKGLSRDMKELLEIPVDWREVLRAFITNTCIGADYATYDRPDRRYLSEGFIMPSGVSEQVGCIAEHNDMSGSIGERVQQIMISSLVGICETVKPDELHVSYWDTNVCGYEKYMHDEIDTVASKTKPVGGGGTDVRCVPQYLKEHNIKPQVSIVLTDGYLYGGWGVWDHPVLWVIVDNKSATPDVGQVVHIKSTEI